MGVCCMCAYLLHVCLPGDIAVDPLIAKARVSSRPTHGPLVVCVYKYTNCAGDFYQQFVDKNVSLYQIQCLRLPDGRFELLL